MSRTLWVNDRLTAAPAIDPRDRGFTLGDGLFETVRALGGRLPLLPLHLGRLRASAAVIDLPLPWTDAFLASAVASVLSTNALADAAVRLSVSRGVPSRRGLLPDPQPVPTLIIDAEPFSGYPDPLYERGAAVVTSGMRRDERSPLASVKSLSRLEQVLVRQAAARAGADEAIVLNTAGRIAGASAANVFAVGDGRLLTPALEEGALPGIVRGLVLDEIGEAAGLIVVQGELTRDELLRADAAFLTSALLGSLRISSLDGQPVGQATSAMARLGALLTERLAEG
jgi:branched-chain amino acid aminotransferase